MDIHKIRQETAVTQHYAYFDTGAAAPPPLPVLECVKNYLDATAQQGTYLPSLRKKIYARVEQVHQLAADFLGADADEIALTKNGSEGISMVAQGIAWQPDDEVIVPNTEILSNLSPWLRLAETRGIKVVRAFANSEGIIECEHIRSLITPRTRLLTFCSLSNATGALQPVKALCALAKEKGILTLVNASQSLGLMDTNVRELDCDFLSACGRKGLRAIEGSGIMYVRRCLIGQMEPCLIGWWNSGFDNETQQLTLPDSAKRFEAGCPNVPAILSLGAAIEYAQTLGMTAIEERVRHLTLYAVERLATLPDFELYGPVNPSQRMGLLPFNIRGVDPVLLVSMLEEQGVIIEAGHFMAHAIMQHYQIERMARMSLHYFNTKEEIDRTVEYIRAFLVSR